MMWFQDSNPGIVALAMTTGRHAVLIKTMIGLVDGLSGAKPIVKIVGAQCSH